MGDFDRFMVHTKIGGHRKIRRLSAAKEGRWCYVAGVLALAAESPERGRLLISEGNPAVEQDIADQAEVSLAVARKTVEIALEMDLLVREGETLVVPSWHDYNPAPRVDPTASRRMELHRNPELREQVRRRDEGRCRYCSKEVRWTDRRSHEGGTFDHIDPLAGNAVDNLVVACRGCNARKGQRTPKEAGLRLLPEPSADLARSSARPDAPARSEQNEVEVEVEETTSSTTEVPVARAKEEAEVLALRRTA